MRRYIERGLNCYFYVEMLEKIEYNEIYGSGRNKKIRPGRPAMNYAETGRNYDMDSMVDKSG